jgi:hypothetical protein
VREIEFNNRIVTNARRIVVVSARRREYADQKDAEKESHRKNEHPDEYGQYIQ